MIFVFTAGVIPSLAQEGGDGPQPVGLRPDAPAYAGHGPYWVGTMEVVINPDSERHLPVTVWYPALNPEAKPEEISYAAFPGFTIAGHALTDAVADTAHGPYPLVVFSHGAWTARQAYSHHTEHLASYGFVVLAVSHTGNTLLDMDKAREPFLAYRPLDVRQTIELARTLTEERGKLAGLIDLELVAVAGHSFGGIAALLAAGAQMDWGGLTAFCDRVSSGEAKDEFGLCVIHDTGEELARIAGLESVPTDLWPSMGDPSVDAFVTFAPGGPNLLPLLFGERGLDNVMSPVLLIQGSGDVLAWPADSEYLYQFLPGAQKSYVTLEDANHPVFSSTCKVFPAAFSADMNGFPWCSDPVWDMDRAHDLINHFTTAFLLDILKGDAEAHAALLPDAVRFPGITYQTTLQ